VVAGVLVVVGVLVGVLWVGVVVDEVVGGVVVEFVGVLVVVGVVGVFEAAATGHLPLARRAMLEATSATVVLRFPSTPERLLAESVRLAVAEATAWQLWAASAVETEFSWLLSVLA
jgi:hypothetical protein